jgi:hypothetical protein
MAESFAWAEALLTLSVAALPGLTSLELHRFFWNQDFMDLGGCTNLRLIPSLVRLGLGCFLLRSAHSKLSRILFAVQISAGPGLTVNSMYQPCCEGNSNMHTEGAFHLLFEVVGGRENGRYQ